MYNFSNDEKGKMKNVMKYITSNYEPENKMSELQHSRLIKLVKLLSYKYGIVGYDYDTLEEMINNNNIVMVVENESVYGSKYRTIKEINRYSGDDFAREELSLINHEIVATEIMNYDDFRSYIHHELEKLDDK